MPGWINAFANLGDLQFWDVQKCFVITRRKLSSPGKIPIQLPQLRYPQGAGNICQSVVEAKRNHFVKPLAIFLTLSRVATDSVIAKSTHLLGVLQIIRHHHSAFTCSQVFDRMEAENRHVQDASNPASFVFGAQRVASIFDNH